MSSTTWLTCDATAARLGITRRVLLRYLDIGDIPAYRIGRLVRVRADDVDHFVRVRSTMGRS
jgi:excisionase family DNA binding protein